MSRAVLVRTGVMSIVALAVVGCGDRLLDGADGASAADTPSTSPSPSPQTWVAVIDVASRPSGLDRLTERLVEPLGSALVVSPTDCYDGFPEQAGNGYVIGAVGDSRAEAERRVVDAGEDVLFSASVTVLCTD